MKRIIAMMALLLMTGTGAAFAAGGTATINAGQSYTGQEGSNAAVVLGKLSTNVSAYLDYATTVYAAITKHLSGSRTFGASSDDTRIYYKESTVGAAVVSGDLTASDSSAFATGWTSL